MRIRLWVTWEPAVSKSRPYGYHLELERPYARVPVAGETVDFPRTRFGLAHPVVERVNWDEDMPNLLFGSWEESEGTELESLTEAGFHMSDEQREGCQYCAQARARRSDSQ